MHAITSVIYSLLHIYVMLIGNRSRVDDRDHPYMRSPFLGHMPGQMPPSMHMSGSSDIRVPEMTCHSGEHAVCVCVCVCVGPHHTSFPYPSVFALFGA